jgi:formate-dependent nitrite reductase membrane component NrfD
LTPDPATSILPSPRRSVAALAGNSRDRKAGSVGFVISAAAVLLCPPLLIKDLGRPERFLNMLRVIKPGSPMSVGVWGLVGFSVCAVLTALRERTDERMRVGSLARPIFPLRPLLHLRSALTSLLAGYTGVLLSVSSIPLWARSRLRGRAFFASALSSGASAVLLALPIGGESTATRRKLEQVHQVAAIAEGLALLGFFRRARDVAGPIVNRRQHGRAFLVGGLGLGVVVPVLAALSQRQPIRHLQIITALCTLFGGVFLRYAIVADGRVSAEDPEATFRYTDKPVERPKK